jgi:hypothetical protein
MFGGFSKRSKQPITLLEVVEPEAMYTGMVTFVVKHQFVCRETETGLFQAYRLA